MNDRNTTASLRTVNCDDEEGVVLQRHQFKGTDRVSRPVESPPRRTSTVVVPISGDVDAATLPAVREQINAGIDEAADRLVVDLSQVTFLSIRGAEVLADAQWRARADGVEFSVITGSRAVDHTLRVAELDNRFRCFASVESALALQHDGRSRPVDTASLGAWQAVG
ncbi:MULTISPECIES: STAS domain-containing protein [Rhodococcus]|uniref:STAS domain-containing protein n=1 Tax=Rhodococcus TaxID=1827 RepID=UPI000BE2C504|nr:MULTISPECIES: STAS domain-containing protein [Rhodococcus]MBP1158904.1 anti-anti-sigma factor [Rhodococcus sp. PvR099]MCZ4558767.1 STAS domain-containing protein [Rhodococcus maanshanensis]